jgi:predicted Na+-dependent transporter
MPGRIRMLATKYPELVAVAAAAVLGLSFQRPFVALVHHHGIDAFLIVLVFATALGIEPQSLRRVPAAWRQLLLALAVGISVLPALSWLIAHVVAAGPLRQGITTIGVAPCEIASVATTGMANGDVPLAGGLLIGSTFLTVAAAGPILALETPGASLHPGHVVVTLFLIVVIPLVLGVVVRGLTDLPPPAEAAAGAVSTTAVAVLVALIAAEVHLSWSYIAVLVALMLFLMASVAVGSLVGHFGEKRRGRAILLTTSMRDFAIAAALAAAAYGAAAAAPLGLYGVIVLIWGTGCAGFLRARRGTEPWGRTRGTVARRAYGFIGSCFFGSRPPDAPRDSPS